MNVRSKLPRRRDIPSTNPTDNNWSKHKPDLREDFHQHCAYCGSYDGFSHTYYEVDHFIPKSIFTLNNNIGLCQYDNLVYSCKFCNNIKHHKWPSQDENIPFVNDEGFVDPCSIDFDNHIYRTKNGSIRWRTPLGKWIVEKGFKFDERDYCIKLLWELNELRNLIVKLSIEQKKHNPSSEEYTNIKTQLGEFSITYVFYRNELDEYYKIM